MNIDIVVGGQFGDEGKGQICAQLAHEGMYDFAVRVGGSNAEHRFEAPSGTRHTGRVLPVAGWVDPNVKLVLGAGHMIKMESLFSEIVDLERVHGVDQQSRIYIDPQAGVIDPDHVDRGRGAALFRGSTHQGNGQAVAHKVARDGEFKTARDYSDLKPFISDTVDLMRDLMNSGKCGLLEGSQGALLSLNHGYYPYCTSKDVTPAALLAEAGIATDKVRDIWAVYRTVPMRVPGHSGPSLGGEISWEDLEKAVGTEIPESAKRQTDSGDRERVFLWSWFEFRKSVALIGPNRMALTFADWWPAPLMDLTLTDLIRDMERVAGCEVDIIRTGPAWGDFMPKEPSNSVEREG